MFMAFNLDLDESFFKRYGYYVLLGKTQLNPLKANYRHELEKYIFDPIIDGTKVQDIWFPQIDADVFISHSHKDENLANALAGWLFDTFGLRCFIDSNVWEFAGDLQKKMCAVLGDTSEKNQVAQHVHSMLSIALQKMIDRVEAVFLLNTSNSVEIFDGPQMSKTYSPWIYSEIVCTEIVRKKPLFVYRDYSRVIVESTEDIMMEFVVSYDVSLDHMQELNIDDLSSWKLKYDLGDDYKYPLDALYSIKCPDELRAARKIAGALPQKQMEMIKEQYTLGKRQKRKGDMQPDYEKKSRVWYCPYRDCLLCSRFIID